MLVSRTAAMARMQRLHAEAARLVQAMANPEVNATKIETGNPSLCFSPDLSLLHSPVEQADELSTVIIDTQYQFDADSFFTEFIDGSS
jgi:hypothetical protein